MLNGDIGTFNSWIINIHGTTGTTSIFPDGFEDNDDFASAWDFGGLGNASEPSLTMDETGDDDYYRFMALSTGDLKIDLLFSDSYGNLDLYVYDSAEQFLMSSTSTTNNEQLTVAVTENEEYFVRVAGEMHPSYSLLIDGPDLTDEIYFSVNKSGKLLNSDLTELDVDDSDIVLLTIYDDGSFEHEIHFDGSDVELTTSGEDIDAFAIRDDG